MIFEAVNRSFDIFSRCIPVILNLKQYKKEEQMKYEIDITNTEGRSFRDETEAKKYAQELANSTGHPVVINTWMYYNKIEIKPEVKPQWIPALVKYQNPTPSWWRMKEEKSKLMGQCILVEKVDPKDIQINMLNQDRNEGHCDYRSKRPNGMNPSGNWYWHKNDLILYPTQDDIVVHNSIKTTMEVMNKAYKRRPLD